MLNQQNKGLGSRPRLAEDKVTFKGNEIPQRTLVIMGILHLANKTEDERGKWVTDNSHLLPLHLNIKCIIATVNYATAAGNTWDLIVEEATRLKLLIDGTPPVKDVFLWYLGLLAESKMIKSI